MSYKSTGYSWHWWCYLAEQEETVTVCDNKYGTTQTTGPQPLIAAILRPSCNSIKDALMLNAGALRLANIELAV